MPWFLLNVARAYAELGQFGDARYSIREAMTVVQTTKERWCEAEVNRVAGEIALLSPERDANTGSVDKDMDGCTVRLEKA
jgi:hypothetical protein